MAFQSVGSACLVHGANRPEKPFILVKTGLPLNVCNNREPRRSSNAPRVMGPAANGLAARSRRGRPRGTEGISTRLSPGRYGPPARGLRTAVGLPLTTRNRPLNRGKGRQVAQTPPPLNRTGNLQSKFDGAAHIHEAHDIVVYGVAFLKWGTSSSP